MFKCEQDFTVPYDDAKVAEGALSGRLYVAGPSDANGNANWRFLTEAEEATYNAAHEHHRADDDGMGAAIGARPGVSGDFINEDDLGAKWGSVDDAPGASPEVAAIEATMASTEHAVWELGLGEVPPVDVERSLADQAIAFINSTVGNLDKTRYTLVVFHMGDVNSETTGGQLESYSLISTIDRKALSQVALSEAMKALDGAALADDNATSLEI